MAPIPSASAISSMPALLASPWLKWSLLVVFAILLVSLAALILVWVYRRAMKSVSTFIERVHERKLVLPTHLDPRMSRPIVLPLPPNFTSMTQTVNAESSTVNNDDTGTKFISTQFCLSLWLSTSLDHITLDECLQHEESIDEPEACDTPALSPSLDTDNDSYDSSLQTPPLESAPSPVSHFTKDLAVVDDNYGPAADIRVFGALTPTTAFTGSLCLADLCYSDLKGFDSDDEESFYSQDSFISSDSLYDPGIPTIVISEALDDTCSRYPYESPTLPSTPSTAALYTLGLPTLAHECHGPNAISPPPAPIPIPFSPTLHPDSYIWVPPPGSDEYFLSFEPTPNDEDEPQHDEEPSPDLSRLGLRSTSGSSNGTSDNNGCTFDWNRLLAQEAERDYEKVDNGLRSAFSTDSDLASDDEDEDDPDSDEEPPTNLPHPGLRLRSTIGSGNVASDDGGTFDWNRLGQQREDSGLRSAFSTDSDLAIIDEEDEEDDGDEDEEDEDEEEYDEEDEYAPDSEEAPPSNMSRQGLWSTSDNMDVASEDIGTYESEDSGLRSAFSTDSDLATIDEEDEDEEEYDEEDEYAPDSEEAPPSNMSRQGLWSTSDNMDVASEDIGTDYDWQQQEDSGLRSAFSTDSDLATIDEEDEGDEGDEEDRDASDDDDEDEDEDAPDSEEAPPFNMSRQGLWFISDNTNVASEDIGTYDSEDSGLRSAFSTDSDLAIDDDDEENDDEEDDDNGDNEDEEDDEDDDDDDDLSVVILRLGLWPPTYGCDATTEQPHSAKRHEQP